jgi:hypothetical protein
LLLIVGLAVGQERSPLDAPNAASECLQRLCSADTHWKLFAACEERLKALPATEVMPLVSEHALDKMPASFGIWNGSGSAESERDGPLPWRIYYSLHRIWRHHIQHAPVDDLRRILVATSGGKMDDDRACVELYLDHRRYGVDGEPPDPRDVVFGATADRVLRDTKRELADRCAGASVLRMMGRQEETLDVLLELPSTRQVIELLAGAATIEPRAVTKAFEYVEATIQANPGYVHAAYFAALDAERVLDATSSKSRFAPDPSDPKYQPPPEGGGLKDEFFQETVDNALAWWKEHRTEYTPEALERRRAAEARAKAEAEEHERAAAAERERNKQVRLQTGQRRRVTIGTVVTFSTEHDVVQYILYAGTPTPSSQESAADHVAKYGTRRESGALFEVVDARGDCLARARFDGDSEVTWVFSREALENAAAER